MRIVSVHAHFWDVFLQQPVSHHSRAFQRKWGQDSNLAIVKCWFSFVSTFCCWFTPVFWIIVMLNDPTSFEFQITNRRSAPDTTWNSLVPQCLQDFQTLRQQISPIIIAFFPQYFTVAMRFWRWYRKFCILYIFFRYIKKNAQRDNNALASIFLCFLSVFYFCVEWSATPLTATKVTNHGSYTMNCRYV